MMIPASLASLWAARSHREQMLLIAMAVSIVLVGAWLGAVLPLRAAATGARAHHARAVETWIEVETALPVIAASAGVAPLPAGGLEDAVTASASASGIALDRNRSDSAAEITAWASAVEPGTLFNWISVLQQAHGVTVTNLTAKRNPEGALDVEVRLARSGP